MDFWLDAVQWPAMVVTIVAAWLVGSTSRLRRLWGFWIFIASNVLWIVWGWHTSAWALIVLQVALAAMNIRGASKAEPADAREKTPQKTPAKAPARRRARA